MGLKIIYIFKENALIIYKLIITQSIAQIYLNEFN